MKKVVMHLGSVDDRCINIEKRVDDNEEKANNDNIKILQNQRNLDLSFDIWKEKQNSES